MNIVATYIGDNEPNCLPLSLDSVLPYVDKVVFIWGCECTETKKILDNAILVVYTTSVEVMDISE